MEFVYQHLTTIAWVVALLLLAMSYKWVLWLFDVIIVPDDSIGVVTKKFVLLGTSTAVRDRHHLRVCEPFGFARPRLLRAAECERENQPDRRERHGRERDR